MPRPTSRAPTSSSTEAGLPGKYRTWAGSLVHPQERLLPGLGARLPPWVASAAFDGLRRLPTKRLRAAAYRHVSRPLAERMRGELVVRVTGGMRMHADPADVPGRTVATAGVWEWNVGAAIRRLLGPGDVFVDVGANTGYYTVLAARTVGPGGYVYSIEPAPGTFRELRRNLELNGLGESVTAVEAAAGAAEGSATLYGPAEGHNTTSSLRRPRTDATATEVRVVPLHTIVSIDHLDRIRLVKIDVEGHEDDVLRGFEPLLERGARPMLLVEVHAAFNPDSPGFVADFCARHRLRARWVTEDLGIDDHLAPADRRLVLRELGSPPTLHTLPRDPCVLLLEPMS